MIKKENYTLYLGSMLDVLDTLPENSIDSVVTDPPYEIGFMNKGWDNSGIAFSVKTWKKVLRALKPGGHLLAFNHSRTFHRMAVAIEDSGFQIRDTIMWMYGSGFPKSHNISIGINKKFGAERGVVGQKKQRANGKSSYIPMNASIGDLEIITTAATDEAKQWDGWGTALKPSYEPIIMARKPLDGTIADNVLKHGVGGINIDGCRVGTEERKNPQAGYIRRGRTDEEVFFGIDKNKPKEELKVNGRFPANTIHDGSDEVTEGFPETTSGTLSPHHNIGNNALDIFPVNNYKEHTLKEYGGDSGSASRFFYTAKTSKKDRDEGLDGFATGKVGHGNLGNSKGMERFDTVGRNIHPTVKPTDLMQYLIRLVTPKGGKVLDPFMGSGSTGKAAMIENNERNAGYHFIGIDLSQEYIDIAESRIEYGINYRENKAVEEERQTLGNNQIRLEL